MIEDTNYVKNLKHDYNVFEAGYNSAVMEITEMWITCKDDIEFSKYLSDLITTIKG